jgi:hypothetical protein
MSEDPASRARRHSASPVSGPHDRSRLRIDLHKAWYVALMGIAAIFGAMVGDKAMHTESFGGPAILIVANGAALLTMLVGLVFVCFNATRTFGVSGLFLGFGVVLGFWVVVGWHRAVASSQSNAPELDGRMTCVVRDCSSRDSSLAHSWRLVLPRTAARAR